MKTRFRFGLQFKFIATITAIVVFTAIALSSFFIYTQNNILQNALKTKTEEIAKRVANSSEINISSQKNLLQYAADAALLEKDVIYVVIYDRNIVRLAEAGAANVEIRDFLFHNTPDITENILFGKKETKSYSYKIKNVGEIFEVFVPIVTYDKLREIAGASLAHSNIREEEPFIDDDRANITGIVRVGVTVENLNEEIARVSQGIVLITILVVIIGVLLSSFFVRVLIDPIKELSLGTKKIASGELSYRVPLTSNDELSDLAESFNSMARDLKSYVDELNDEKQDLIRLKGMLEQRSKELEETLSKMQDIQEELLRSEKFATIGRLAASVAHELRNPLASLKNISYYLSKTGKFQDEKSKKMLEMLSADVVRANKIITDLLDYSRAKRLNKLEIWMDEFMDKAISNVHIPSNIEISKDFEHFKAIIDPDKITQVIINLISNARDAMPNGGLIKTSVRAKNRFLEIIIEDTGIGMKKDTVSHIFDPLFTTKLKGIGLGLSIVKEIIDAHFGKIEVESEEGKGTKFTILLPVE